MSDPATNTPISAPSSEPTDAIPEPHEQPASESLPDTPAIKPPFSSLLGIDFGTTKVVTALARHDSALIPNIVRNETADLYTTNIISFKGEERLLGEAAVGHSNIHPQNAVEKVNRFLGKTKAELDPEIVKNVTNLSEGPSGEALFQVPYNSETKRFKPEQIAAIILKRVQKFSDTLAKSHDEPPVRDVVFVVPCSFDQRQLQALKDAAHIANFNVHGFYRGPSAIATMYGLKHPIKEGEGEKNVAFVDMGASEFTLSLSKFGVNSAEVIEVLHTTNGGQDFDRSLFHFVQDFVAKNHPGVDISSQRQIRRIYAAVNKAKNVLSTINRTEIVFPLADQDIRIPITRDQFHEIAKPDIQAIEGIVAQFKQKITDLGVELHVLEVIGGGARMNFVGELLSKTFELPLSRTLDSDLDQAVGVAALGASNTVGFELNFQHKDNSFPDFGKDVPHFFSESELKELVLEEEKMQAKDDEITLKFRARNNLETYCFEMINTLRDDKVKGCFPDISKRNEFEEKLNEALAWIDINSDLTTQDLEARLNELQEFGKTTLPELFQKLDDLAKEKAANEAKAAAEATLNAAQSSEKKPKTNTQKLEVAQERKSLGNKHFVDLDYPSAVKLYKQALELAISIYDETPDQKKEADSIKLACYLNIAQCLIKTKLYDKAVENCKLALAIDPDNTKALFRRGNAYFFTKEWELARVDLAKAAKLSPEDKTIKSLLAKTEAQVAAQKEREKAMCARMFG